MNDRKKQALLLAVIGFVIGMPIGAAILLWVEPGAYTGGAPVYAIVLHILISGVYGAICVGSTVIYDIDAWSITRTTATHFLITMGSFCGFYALGIAVHWITPPHALDLFLMFAAMIAAYFIIWLIQYLTWRRKVKSMNETLNKMKDDDHLN